MSLSKIIEEVKQIKSFVDEDVSTGPVETLNARRGRKNQALERMKTLKFEYRLGLLESAAFIVVTGDKRDAFTSTAVENFKCFSTDPNTFYEDLAGRIPPVVYQGKESLSSLFDILGRHLEDKARELGLSEYPQLIFKQQYRVTIKDKSDLVGLVKQAINDQMGSEILGIQAVQSLLDTALTRGHKALVTPIILSTDDTKLATELQSTLKRLKTRGVFLVAAGKSNKALKSAPGSIQIKDPTAETVGQALKTISGETVGE